MVYLPAPEWHLIYEGFQRVQLPSIENSNALLWLVNEHDKFVLNLEKMLRLIYTASLCPSPRLRQQCKWNNSFAARFQEIEYRSL